MRHRVLACAVAWSSCLGVAAMALAQEAGVPVGLQPLFRMDGRPTALTHASDGSGRLFVGTQDGRIFVWSNGLLQPFFGVPTFGISEHGLLGLAFHPRHSENRRFFASYTDRQNGDSLVVEYRTSPDDPNLGDVASGRELLRVAHSHGNHRAGHIAFGPDGYLYVAIGDGWDEEGAQDKTKLVGKILRLDVDALDGSPYQIPSGNPFAGDPSARGEVWALGLRNPWRFSFDRLTGDLLVGDVGDSGCEEINVAAAGTPGGLNYGWPRMEGSTCFQPEIGCDASLVTPVVCYGAGQAEGCAVIGGYRYRGSRFPELQGLYLHSDWCSGRVYGVFETDGAWQQASVGKLDGFRPTTFGEDEAGELYIAGNDPAGTGVYRVVSNAGRTISVSGGGPVAEAGGEVSFTLTLSSPAEEPVSVYVTTVNGTALAGRDFVAWAGRVEFTPGEAEKTLRVALIADNLDETDSVFSLRLSDSAWASIDVAEKTATILDDDATPTVSVGDCEVVEAEGNFQCTFFVRLSAPSGQATQVAYATAAGTAQPGEFVPVSGTLSFAAGQTQSFVQVTTWGDTLDENDETFFLNLSLTPTSNLVLGDAQGRGLIRDDDDPPPTTPPTLLEPREVVPGAIPTFRWTAVTGGQRYRLTVHAPGRGHVFQREYWSEPCSGSTCSVASPVELPERDYEWTVTVGNRVGWGAESLPQTFTVDLPAHVIMTVAGNGAAASAGDGGWAFTSSVSGPRALAVDAGGHLWIGEGSRIRKVDARSEIITTAAGHAGFGCGADGSRIVSPGAIASDRNGHVYFTESATQCSRVRRIDAVTGAVTIVAGQASLGYGGDGGPATAAGFAGALWGLVVDPQGHIFVTDTAANRVRRIDADTAIITTVAGNGASASAGDGGPARQASLKTPAGLALDGAGNLFVAEYGGHRVRRIDAQTGIITTAAGDGTAGSTGDEGPAVAARLHHPRGIAADAFGNLWIGDSGNRRVRRVDASRGTIVTMARDGIVSGIVGDGRSPLSARLLGVDDVALDADGNLFIADSYGYRVRKVDNRRPVVTASEDVTVEQGQPATLRLESSFDADADPLSDLEWRDAGGRLVATGSSFSAVWPAGSHLFTLVARDGFGGMASDSASVTVREPVPPPTVSITHPRDEVAYTSRPLTIEWMASGSLVGFDVFLSDTGGAAFKPVCPGLDGSARSCTVDTPGNETRQAVARVVARDGVGRTASDQAPFVIEPPPGGGTGLRATYWDNKDLTAFKLARTDAAVDFDWGTGAPAAGVSTNTFSVRWTGVIQPRYSETYTLYTISDDGVRVWVDGVLLINNWTNHVATENSATVMLEPWRRHTIRVEYYDDQGSARIQLLWSSASQPKQVVPATQLYPASVYESFDDGVAGGWTAVSGSWSIVTDGTPAYRSSPGASLSRAVVGDPAWRNGAIGAKIKVAGWGSTTSRTVGLLARYQDPNNYYLCVWENGELKIKRKVGGVLTTVLSRPFTLVTGRWYAFSVHFDMSEISLAVDGTVHVAIPDDALPSGKAGVISVYGDARFDEFMVVPID